MNDPLITALFVVNEGAVILTKVRTLSVSTVFSPPRIWVTVKLAVNSFSLKSVIYSGKLLKTKGIKT